MKKPKTIVFYIFLAYNLFLFLATLYVDSKQNDLGFLLEMKSYLSFFKYFTLFGLVLYLLSYLLIQRDNTKLSKEIRKEKDEITNLKAKLFDYQEKGKPDPGKIETPAKPELEPPSSEPSKPDSE